MQKKRFCFAASAIKSYLCSSVNECNEYQIKSIDNMYNKFQKYLQEEIQGIKDAGLYKNERVIITPQSAAIKTAEAGDVLNFCANNYLGLADSKVLI